MKNTVVQYSLIFLLAAAAVSQFIIAGIRRPSDDSESNEFVVVGEDLSEVRAFDARGEEVALVTGEPLVVLVFDSKCVYCTELASQWAEWMRRPGHGERAIALSSDTYRTANAFASDHGWRAEVRTVVPGPVASALTKRTPWVYVLDGKGRVMSEGHGAHLERLVAVLWEETTKGGGP